jgi:hypothetical protein
MSEIRLIRSLTFQPDGSVAVEYVTPATDVKANGLEINHVLLIPRDSDYDDELDAVMEAVNAMLEDAIEDLDTAAPFDFSSDDDEDDEDENV